MAITKVFPATDVLTVVSGRMVAVRSNTDVLYDLAEFVLNDPYFSEEARGAAPYGIMQKLLKVADKLAAELAHQFPQLEGFPIPKEVTLDWILDTDEYFGDLEVKQMAPTA
jgi:hypothetical protein